MIIFFFFFFNDTATTEIYTLSLHDALPIFNRTVPMWTAEEDAVLGTMRDKKLARRLKRSYKAVAARRKQKGILPRSEEHTSELQSPCNLVCRLLLEKKKKKQNIQQRHMQ